MKPKIVFVKIPAAVAHGYAVLLPDPALSTGPGDARLGADDDVVAGHRAVEQSTEDGLGVAAAVAVCRVDEVAAGLDERTQVVACLVAVDGNYDDVNRLCSEIANATVLPAEKAGMPCTVRKTATPASANGVAKPDG